MYDKTQQALTSRFERFASDCAALDSPFYERLSMLVANHSGLLDLAACAPREPIPNLFFGAVHYLLLDGAQHDLREYYPSIAKQPREDANLLATLACFCSRFRLELERLVKSRLVQTNEVNRCAVLAPAFAIAYEEGRRQPMTVVEIGASAGLNLLWDRYRIAYSDGSVLGDSESKIRIACDNRGVPIAPGLARRPHIAGRVGVDLNPVDLHDEDARLWLRALVWPDHRERAARLEAAIELAVQSTLKLIRGDALKVIPRLLADVPRETTLCVYHSSVLYQFSHEERELFASLLADSSTDRPIWQVSAENEEGLWLHNYRGGRMASKQFLGDFDAHGRWLCWRCNDSRYQ
jgi:hypothetical protein